MFLAVPLSILQIFITVLYSYVTDSNSLYMVSIYVQDVCRASIPFEGSVAWAAFPSISTFISDDPGIIGPGMEATAPSGRKGHICTPNTLQTPYFSIIPASHMAFAPPVVSSDGWKIQSTL